MPCAAAAAVTSGSLAAPSSIEYSVWTCRWANESVLLTGTCGSSVVVRAEPSGPWNQDDGRRPAGETGGAGRACARSGGAAVSILARGEVYAEGLTERVFSQRTGKGPRPPHPSQARDEPLDGASRLRAT